MISLHEIPRESVDVLNLLPLVDRQAISSFVQMHSDSYVFLYAPNITNEDSPDWHVYFRANDADEDWYWDDPVERDYWLDRFLRTHLSINEDAIRRLTRYTAAYSIDEVR